MTAAGRIAQWTLGASIALAGMASVVAAETNAPTRSANSPAKMQDAHDGSHDFDFLIGNWKAHVRVLRDRLKGSNDWVEYDGISNHKKLLDSNANFEEFDANSAELHERNKGQTLRLYNPETLINGQSIWLILTRVHSTCRPLSVNSWASAESSTIKTPTRAELYVCTMFGWN